MCPVLRDLASRVIESAGIGRAGRTDAPMDRSSRKTRRGRRVAAVLVLVVALLAACWWSGLVGRALACYVLPRLFPIRERSGVEVTSLDCCGAGGLPGRGLTLTVSPGRVADLLRRAWPYHRLLPPGLVRDGLVLRGSVRPEDWPAEAGHTVPFAVVIDDATGDPPRLSLRCPRDELNALVKRELLFDLSKEREWALGTYDYRWVPVFETLTLYSEQPAGRGPIEERRFPFVATGRVRFRFEENLFDARATARVNRLSGHFLLRFRHAEDGLVLGYDAVVSELSANVHNLLPWGDEKASEALRRSMSRSLNRRRKQERMARKRFPAWLPLDIMVDVKLTE